MWFLHSAGAGVADVPPLEQYLDKITERLVEASAAPGLPIETYVMSSDNAGASALPSGVVAVDWGLFLQVENEDELAFVLAHEIAHVFYKHYETDWFLNAQHFAVTLTSYADKAMEIRRELTGKESEKDEDIADAALASEVSYVLSKGVIKPAWQREQEDEADRFAIDLLVKAGYNPAVAMRYFAKLEQIENQTGKESDALTGLLERMDFSAQNNRDFGEFIDDMLVAGAELFSKIFGGDDHYPAAERSQAVQKYFLEEHAGTKLPKLTKFPWEAGDPDAAGAYEVVRRYTIAHESRKAILAGELQAAEDLIRKAVEKPRFWSDGYLRYVFYTLRTRQQRTKSAVQNLDIALEAEKPGLWFFLQRIRQEEAAGDFERAVDILDDARRRLGDPPALLAERIRLYPLVGRGDEVPGLLVECQLNWREYASQCDQAMSEYTL